MPRQRQEFARPLSVSAPTGSAMPVARPVLPHETRSDQLRQRLLFAIGPTLLIAMGVTVVASAQSNSPFASEKKVQAWETPAAAKPIPPVETRASSNQPVTASVRQGLAGPAPSLRLRSAPRSQSDAMSGRSAPRQAPAEPAANAAPNPPSRSASRVTSDLAGSVATSETQTGQAESAQIKTVEAPARITGPVSQGPSQGVILTPEQLQARMSLPRTASATPSVPNRWTLGSSYGSSTDRRTSQSWSAHTRSMSDSSASVATAVQSAPQAGAYQSRAQQPANTEWSDFEPEAPLPYAYYPPGTRPSANRSAQASFGGPANSQQPASPFARSQTRTQAWEQDGQTRQPSPYVPSPQGQPSTAPSQGPFTPGPNARQTSPQGWTPPQGQAQPHSQRPPSSGPYDQYYPNGYPPGAAPSGPFDTLQQQGPYSGPMDQQSPQNRGWFDRIGLGALSTFIRGGLRLGAGARENDSWGEVFIGDADVEAEVSAVTQGGLEWGVHGQVRAQYDEGRKGFTRRLPDCPPTLMGCPSVLVMGTPTAVRGHTSQFYTFGPDVGEDTRIALESAHLFLRSAYGDVTVGRDDGAAYLFSLGAPTLLNVGASNSGVDYTGLDAVRTRNEATGFAEKITYTSPRLLGDQVGIGIQLGASYAPDAEACGVDYCVEPDSITGVVAPVIEDVLEAGIALDRTFANGMSVEGTLTYAQGSEQSGLAEMDDLQAYGAGIEVKLSDWTLGGSFLQSNQGLLAGDYTAYDVGLTWQPSQLGFTLGYGHAEDDLVGLTSDQIVGGVTFDLNERIRLGAGVQYTERESLRDVAGTAQLGNEKATALFIEGGLKF